MCVCVCFVCVCERPFHSHGCARERKRTGGENIVCAEGAPEDASASSCMQFKGTKEDRNATESKDMSTSPVTSLTATPRGERGRMEPSKYFWDELCGQGSDHDEHFFACFFGRKPSDDTVKVQPMDYDSERSMHVKGPLVPSAQEDSASEGRQVQKPAVSAEAEKRIDVMLECDTSPSMDGKLTSIHTLEENMRAIRSAVRDETNTKDSERARIVIEQMKNSNWCGGDDASALDRELGGAATVAHVAEVQRKFYDTNSYGDDSARSHTTMSKRTLQFREREMRVSQARRTRRRGAVRNTENPFANVRLSDFDEFRVRKKSSGDEGGSHIYLKGAFIPPGACMYAHIQEVRLPLADPGPHFYFSPLTHPGQT